MPNVSAMFPIHLRRPGRRNLLRLQTEVSHSLLQSNGASLIDVFHVYTTYTHDLEIANRIYPCDIEKLQKAFIQNFNVAHGDISREADQSTTSN